MSHCFSRSQLALQNIRTILAKNLRNFKCEFPESTVLKIFNEIFFSNGLCSFFFAQANKIISFSDKLMSNQIFGEDKVRVELRPNMANRLRECPVLMVTFITLSLIYDGFFHYEVIIQKVLYNKCSIFENIVPYFTGNISFYHPAIT